MQLDALLEAIAPNLDREYPHRVIYDGQRDADWQPPRRRHPIFFGCYDWHSAVHNHWAVLRLARAAPALSERAAALLVPRLTGEAVERELDFFAERPGFELPYGLAWAALLGAELACAAAVAPTWRTAATAFAPLTELALTRLERWALALPTAIRAGEHSQSAFAMTLALTSARALGRHAAAGKLTERALALHERDRDYALHLEPSAWDFVSPTLGAAWLLCRCLPAGAFADWLTRAAPTLGHAPLPYSPSADRNDGKLAHWDGLLWSRAWMLRDLAAHLPAEDPRRRALAEDAQAHAAAATFALGRASYAGLHWLPTFATVWATGGLDLATASAGASHGTPGER